MSKLKQFCILSFLSFCILIGCFTFCRGFLLNRQVFTEKSIPCINAPNRRNLPEVNIKNDEGVKQTLPKSWCNAEPAFSSAIFVLIDAFRYDFIHRMPFMSGLLERRHNQQREIINSNQDEISACAFKFIADPPTTTMQRLKALMSGTMPTFIDASANFNSYEVEEDNLIFQLHAAGKRIAFLGDDTWLSLFPKSLFNSPYVESHPSFNAWDLDTVDRAVNESIIRFLQPEHVSNWDVLIAHLLGVDHCGHRYGPSHPEMQRKLEEADKTIKLVFNKMADDTLLIVFGDHGMTKTGDHGGDSTNEVEAMLLFVTKQIRRINPPFKCQSNFKNPQTVSQIDLVPTVSTLLGLPIPYSSIGQIIPKFLAKDLYTEAIIGNVAQVSQYIEKYGTIYASELQEIKELLDEAFNDFNIDKQNFSKRERLHRTAEKYLFSVRNHALSTWTQFDMISIYWGFGITVLAIFSMILFLNLVHRRNFSWIPVLLSSCGISSVLLNYMLGSAFGLFGIKLMSSFGLPLFILFSLCTPCNKSSKPLRDYQELPRNSLVSDFVSIIFYVVTCAAVFSNSFVINEGYVLGSVFLAVACLYVLLQQCTERKELQSVNRAKIRGFLANKKIFIWKNGTRGSWVSLLFFAILLRAGTLFFRCREELTECQEVFILHKHVTSLPEDWVVYKCVRFGVALLSVATFVVTFREWMMMRKCISSSTRPAAILGKYMPTVLIVLTGAHWALEGLPFSIPHIVMLRPALNHFLLVYQTLTILALIVIWIDPLCCFGTSRVSNFNSAEEAEKEHQTSNSGDISKVQGNFLAKKSKAKKNGMVSVRHYPIEDNLCQLRPDPTAFSETLCEDVYSSSLLISCVFVVLLLVQVTVTGITPAVVMIPFVITSITGLTSASTYQNSWSLSIIWVLGSQYFFYGTGHQAVFSAIPWDSAFIGSTEGLGSSVAYSWISWIRPGFAVLGNLHASQIIFSMALPLVVYWKGHSMPESLLGKNERSELYSFGGKFIILHGVKLLACMVAAAHHRRHLMVWKIFAPKLVFEIVSFIMILITTTLSLLFVTRVDYRFQNVLEKERKDMNQLLRANP